MRSVKDTPRTRRAREDARAFAEFATDIYYTRHTHALTTLISAIDNVLPVGKRPCPDENTRCNLSYRKV